MTEQQITAVTLQAEGKTYTEIAAIMGTTKSAVAGMISRYRDSLPKPEPIEDPGALVPLMKLKWHHCRYVVDTEHSLFCGKPKYGSTSWCEEHKAIVFYKRR